MPKPMYRCTVRGEFSASHALRHYGGKCESVHGHNFAVEVCVVGGTLQPGTEILVDFTVLKRALKELLETLDHKHLNEVPPFDAHNPSSENLAQYIYRALAPVVLQEGARLECVSVSEKSAQTATYWEEA